ncbi:MAG: hypothetical protein H5T42_02565 [Methanothrix sp.]|uniref:hypothetical protein n=1 Tax=Methanothrix sp. TaxID=90426 RepID=UPI0019B631D4|nr:hypothetical protein [Methanothrix sp.]
MKYCKIGIALLAMCALIAPALSAPDAGNDKQAENRIVAAGCGMSDDQIKDGCLPPRAKTTGPDAEKPALKSMMDGRLDRPDMRELPADDTSDKPVAEKPALKSMMDGRLDRPDMRGLPADDTSDKPVAEKPAPKSMMDGKIDRINTVPGKGSVYVVIVQA